MLGSFGMHCNFNGNGYLMDIKTKLRNRCILNLMEILRDNYYNAVALLYDYAFIILIFLHDFLYENILFCYPTQLFILLHQISWFIIFGTTILTSFAYRFLHKFEIQLYVNAFWVRFIDFLSHCKKW